MHMCARGIYLFSALGLFWQCEMSNVPFKTSLTPPSFIEVHISSQESRRSCICVLEVTILSLSTILIFHFHFISSLILIKYMGVKHVCFWFGSFRVDASNIDLLVPRLVLLSY
jgi:hypothetical protein